MAHAAESAVQRKVSRENGEREISLVQHRQNITKYRC